MPRAVSPYPYQLSTLTLTAFPHIYSNYFERPALYILHNCSGERWPSLREKVARLLGQAVEKMGDAQWIGYILKRLHLIDESGRKRGMDGVAYAVKPSEVLDMMRRYDVAIVYESR